MTDLGSEDFLGTVRFAVERRLGSGGMGVVYQAHDRDRNIKVALKTLRKALREESASSLYSFKHEFRALADITHANLITLYELISDGDQWFFTMELVDGVGLLDYIWSLPEPATSAKLIPNFEQLNEKTRHNVLRAARLNTTQLRVALRQLAEGVCALHQAGKLHRDLKPSNVMVTNRDRVVILDFGLVTEVEACNSEDQFFGTPSHMAPEQAAGMESTTASDWYSVGVILYEALTGRWPYTGNFFEIIKKKQQEDALPPQQLMPNIPEDLAQLCIALLQREASARPTGLEVLNRLRGVTSLLPAPSMINIIRRTIQNTSLVGRDQHLASMHEAFAAIKAGHPITVYIQGSSGMGKSTLVRHFLDEIQSQETDIVVLSGRCYEQESVPYKALDSIVDALSNYLKSLYNQSITLPHDILALARLFPVLRQVDAIQGAAQQVLEIPDSQELRRRAANALRELFGELAKTKTIVIFIDDIQWGDTDSAALIGELLRFPNPPALMMIFCYRSEDADTSPLLNALLSMHNKEETTSVEVREITVSELSIAEARFLVDKLVSEFPAISQYAEKITREAGGNPFFIDELVRYSSPKMFITGPLHTGDLKVNEHAALERVLYTRIHQLSVEARKLLEVVAVAGQPIEREIAKQVALLNGEEQQSLSLLRNNHLIRVREVKLQEELETYHDRIRETILNHISPEQLKDYHLRLANALEATNCADQERLAKHLRRAGELNRAAKYAIAAADRAYNALAFDHAAKLYKATLSMRAWSPEEALPMKIRLGDALANAGRGADAAQAYLDAAAYATEHKSINLRRIAAEQYLISGHVDEGLAVLRPILAKLNLKLADSPRKALLSLSWNKIYIKLRGLKYQKHEEKEIPEKELMRIDTCWTVIRGLTYVDTIRAAEFQARHLLLALAAGEPHRISRALFFETGHRSSSGKRNRTQAEELVAVLFKLVDELKTPIAEARANLAAGAMSYFNGEWQQSCDYAAKADKIFREHCTEVAWELDSVELFRFRSLSFMGNYQELFSRVPIFYKEALERGDLWAVTMVSARFYIASLAADEIDTARLEAEEAIKRWSREGFQLQHYWDLFGRVEIELYAQNGAQAWQLITKRWPLLANSLLLRVQIFFIESLHLHARAALAMASTNEAPRQFLALATRDAQTIEKEDVPWGNGLAHMIYAAVAAANGQRENALQHLNSAETLFYKTGMQLYGAAARYRRGELLKSVEGEELCAEAVKTFGQQMIKNPPRIVALFAPGKWH